MKKRNKIFLKRELILHWDEYGRYEFGIYLYDLKQKLIGSLLFCCGKSQKATVNYSQLQQNYRNRGLGKLLYIEAINQAFSYGYKKIISYGEQRNASSNVIWLTLYKEFPESFQFKIKDHCYIDWIVIKPLVK